MDAQPGLTQAESRDPHILSKSPLWIAGTQAFGWFPAFPGTGRGSQIRSGTARKQISILVGSWHQTQQLNVLRQNTAPTTDFEIFI